MLHVLQGLLLEAWPPVPHHGWHVGPPAPILTTSLTDKATTDLAKMLAVSEPKEDHMKTVRLWVMELPAATREAVMMEVYKQGSGLSRTQYLRMLERCWRLLFSSEWQRIVVPDVGSLLRGREDILSEDESAREEAECVVLLAQLQVARARGRLRGAPLNVPRTDRMTTADLYSSMCDTVSTSPDESYVKVLKLEAYCQKTLPTIKEKIHVFTMISYSPKLTALEIGSAADDSLLWRLATCCPSLARLDINGAEVTDSGLHWMCGRRCPEKDLTCPLRFLAEQEKLPAGSSRLSSTLTHLSMEGCLGVGERGLKVVWQSLQHLVLLQVQQSLLGALVTSVPATDLATLPLQVIELSTSPRHNALLAATLVCPNLQKLTLWHSPNCPEAISLTSWVSFKQLRCLHLNNVLPSELTIILQQIGTQLELLDLDNFSLTDSGDWLDVGQIGQLACRLEHLNLAMTCLAFTCDKRPAGRHLFPCLSTLTLKGNALQNPEVVCSLLKQSPCLKLFTFFHRLTNIHPNRPPTQEPISDDKLAEMLALSSLSCLEMFQVTVSEPDLGHLLLTEESVILLAAGCPRLRSVGNLSTWSIGDILGAMERVKEQLGWTRLVNTTIS